MTERFCGRDESCWAIRTNLELALTGVVLAATVFSVIIWSVLAVTSTQSARVCITSSCIAESARIIQQVDTTVSPCDNIHKFSRGKLREQTAFSLIQANLDRQLIELYSEPISEDDHQMVVLSKKLFKGCMDENSTTKESQATIKKVFSMLGGWPIIEGSNWDETKFDWLDASYKLRELGYTHGIFLDLLVATDPDDSNRHILEIAIPHIEFNDDIESYTKEAMIEIASVLGANNSNILIDVEETLNFMQKLYERSRSSLHDKKVRRKFTITEFAEKFDFYFYINWLEFVNGIAKPVIQLSRNDYVIFPHLDILDNWLYVISMKTQRVQANYMLWKVIEELLPYLKKEHKNNVWKSVVLPYVAENDNSRLHFCLREMQRLFSVSPMNIKYARTYLSSKKKNNLEKLVYNIKENVINVTDNSSWLDLDDKQTVLRKLQEVTIVAGAPNYYMDDTAFDELYTEINANMNSNLGNTFFDLLTLVKRSRQTRYLKRVLKSTTAFQATKQKWFYGNMSDYELYDVKNNIMRIPATLLQKPLFDENRPNYLNYGAIGLLIGLEFSKLFSFNHQWSGVTLTSLKEKEECLISSFKNFLTPMSHGIVFQRAVALHISYMAYKKLSIENSEELRLIGTNFTVNQLFWIQTSRTDEDFSAYHILENLKVIQHNLDFRNDFSCPSITKLNKIRDCNIF